jgi:unsaturated rhamnogalacturonyl hydrolase
MRPEVTDPGIVVRRVVAEAVRQERANELKPHWGDGILVYALARAGAELGIDDATQTAITRLDELIERPVDLKQPSWEWGFLPVAAWEVAASSGRERHREFALEIVTHLLQNAPRTADRALATHRGRPQLWVDTMFFSIPALFRASIETGDGQFRGEARDELQRHLAHLLDERTGLFIHCWDEGMDSAARYTGSGFELLADPPVWARGNAWAFLTTLIAAEYGDSDAQDDLAELARKIVALQDEASGLWHTVIDRPDSYLETSASIMFALGLARASARPDMAFAKQAVDRCWRGVLGKVAPNGQVVGVSAGTPPGAFADYQAVPVGSETFGTGFCILLGLEISGKTTRIRPIF